jgi:hypothetical protein
MPRKCSDAASQEVSATIKEMSDTRKRLVHWVNSLPQESCLMVDGLQDLRDGRAVADIVTMIAREHVQGIVDAQTPRSRLRAVLNWLVSEKQHAGAAS